MLVSDVIQRMEIIQADQPLPDAVVKMGTLEIRRLVGLLTDPEITVALQKSSGSQTPCVLVSGAVHAHARHRDP
ncbi:hypothetical protein [Deinococcus sp. UYEF24]